MLLLMKEQNQKSARVNLKLKQKKRFRRTVSNSRVLMMLILKKKKSEVTEGKFKTDNLVNIKSRKFATSKLSNSL